jgi:hypothetical protein
LAVKVRFAPFVKVAQTSAGLLLSSVTVPPVKVQLTKVAPLTVGAMSSTEPAFPTPTLLVEPEVRPRVLVDDAPVVQFASV